MSKTLEQLNAEAAELDRQRDDLRVKRKKLAEERRRVADAEHAAYYGLTPEDYQKAKQLAREGKMPLAEALGTARKERAVQVAQAGVANLGVKGVDR